MRCSQDQRPSLEPMGALAVISGGYLGRIAQGCNSPGRTGSDPYRYTALATGTTVPVAVFYAQMMLANIRNRYSSSTTIYMYTMYGYNGNKEVCYFNNKVLMKEGGVGDDVNLRLYR